MNTNNFQTAHFLFSEALAALADPYSAAFAESRNSSVAAIRSFRECEANSSFERLVKAGETLHMSHELVSQLINSGADLASCKDSIQALMNKAPQPPVMDITQNEEESSEEEWEIIET